MKQEETVKGHILRAFVLHRPATSVEQFLAENVRRFEHRPQRFRAAMAKAFRAAFARDGFIVIPRGVSVAEKPVALFIDDVLPEMPAKEAAGWTSQAKAKPALLKEGA